MKIRKIAMLLAAVIAVTTVISGCNIQTGTNSSASDTSSASTVSGTESSSETTNLDIPPMTDVDLATVIAKSAVGTEFDITYGEFYEEYMFYLLRNKIDDDTSADYAQECMDKRQSIVQYLMNEKILLHVAHEKGFDTFTTEELDELQATYEENLQQWYKNFEEEATAADSSLSGTALTDKCKELFGAMLAKCNLTEDDLLSWDRNSAIINKLYTDATKDVTAERSEAEDYIKQLADEAKQAFEKSPADYAQDNTYSTVYIPEGSRRIKHILFQFDEETTNAILTARYGDAPDAAKADKLRADNLAGLKAQADEVMAKLEAGENYDELLETYSADKAMALYYPDGYLVVPGSVQFVDEFTNAAFALEKVGDYKLIESDYGYHIVQYSSDATISDEEYNAAIDGILESMQEYKENQTLTAAFAEWVEPYDYDVNYDIIRVIIEETAEVADTEAADTEAADTTSAAETTAQ